MTNTLRRLRKRLIRVDTLTQFGAGLGYDLVLLCANFPQVLGNVTSGGEFVRSRVAAYTATGLAVLVVEVSRRNHAPTVEQHPDYLCLRLAPRDLDKFLRSAAANCRAFAVHVMTPEMVAALGRHVAPERVAYFFHGAEIRDYRRLYFNYDTAQLESARRRLDATHAARMAAARDLIRTARSPLVFVSQYLHRVAERDTGMAIAHGSVIPNYIDGEFYRYSTKTVDAARRVLLIRSFDAANYACDIAVAAILELLAAPIGANLEFTVCGFGRHFRQLTAPLAGYHNVALQEGLLSREEMRNLHDRHGIFLAPSRHDTQGVTMCEAMASGLVPVTHAVGGIPEFVDHDCGQIALDHTPREFARCIAALSSDAGGYLRKSAAAAARVRERCGQHATIDRELRIVAQCTGPDLRAKSPRIVCFDHHAPLVDSARSQVVMVTRRRRSLYLTGSDLQFVVAMPNIDTCRYAYAEGSEARAWLAVARTIGARFARGSVMLIRADDPLLPLALMLKKHYDIDYVLFDTTPAAVSGVRACAVLGNAHGVMLAAGVEAASIGAKYVGPLRILAAPVEIDALLEHAQPAPVAATAQATDRLRVLLVAYYAGPCNTVGVARPNYWFEEFDRLSDGQTELHIATAIRPSEASPRIHFVADFHGIELTERNDPWASWVSEFVATEAQRSTEVNTLGYFWRIALERYFARSSLTYDVVVMTGNPYAYFDFAAFAHAHWGARVVLDYRDPFALNPRFKYTPPARTNAAFIEAGYNFQADLILAATSEFAKLVVGHSEQRVAVVPNGFDERKAAQAVPVTFEGARINFVHAGALYYYGRLDELVDALDPTRHCLHHVGRAPEIAPALVARDTLQLHGPQSYTDTLALIAGADCGIVFLTAAGFETTTKIFDYLCFDLDVLVLSPDATPRGPLAEIGAAGAKLHWVRNTPADIAIFLSNYQASPRRPGVGERYARAASTRYLLHLLGVQDADHERGN